MYKLFTDKAELFECDIKIEGTSLSKSTARLVVETNDYSLMFNGKISTGGKCTIPIKKLKGLIDENTKGNMAAFLGLDDDIVNEICNNYTEGLVVVANYNTKGQVVISGEIESVIKLHEAIGDAAVVGISDSMYDEAIIGFVTLKTNQSVTEEELKEYCSKKMSKSKIPEKIKILNDFPRTSTGKTQKNKLREMFSNN